MNPFRNTQPLVSICIPTYNAARYVEETIQSALNSTYANLEVIVSDDASTDNTLAVVEDLRDDRVRLFQNKANLGAPANWNRAMEKASGELVGLLNHDDLYGPFWLTLVAHVMERHPHIGWMATAFHIISERGQILSVDQRLPDSREYSRDEAFLCIAKRGGMGPGLIARRTILKEVGYYDEAIGPFADHDLCLRLASRYPLYYSSNPHHAAWRYHADNLTHQCLHKDIGMRIIACLQMLSRVFNNRDFPEELRKHEKECTTYFYTGVLKRCQELLEQGDLETAQKLIRLLSENG
jgi:glycosyltransferase involved in cell wall biosynthesis